MHSDVISHRGRLIALCVVLALWGGVIAARLVYWQVIRHEEMVQRALGERLGTVKIPANRGDITDRHGYLLATSVTRYLAYASPKEIGREQFRSVARKIAPLLNLPTEAVYEQLEANKDKYYLPLRGYLIRDVANQVTAAVSTGVYTAPMAMRVYPADSLAQPLLGFTNIDGQGLYGVEGHYDEYLRGVDGVLIAELDAQGRPIPAGHGQLKAVQDGAKLVLTIDASIQYKAETLLRKAIDFYQAVGGTILILDSKTGAILASASEPSYNPNRYYEVQDQGVFRDPAVSVPWEPGSILKIITMAAALDSGIIVPNSTHYCKGYVDVDGFRIWTSDKRAHGQETMVQVLANSCNVGAVYVADLLGKDRFYQYLWRFGFGQLTGVDLAGEVNGTLTMPESRGWRRLTMATNSFGQGLMVTPIQVAAAVGAIANGGLYMKPYIVQRIESAKGIKVTKPTAVAQVVSRQTAQTLTGMLVAAMESIPNNPALVPGYHVAGKTGTAQIWIGDRYDPNLTMTSFIGYAPAEDPRFVILVKIDLPRRFSHAQEVASPVFREMAQWLLLYLGIPPKS